MKKIFFLILPVILLFFAGCEKNDPLSEQGTLTDNVVPFNLLAQMPDASAGDTLTLRTVCWAIDDNIDSVNFTHEGFKLRSFDILMEITFEDSLHVLSTEFTQDTIFTPTTMIASYPEQGQSLNDFYQTQENAYVIEHEFVVPDYYALTNETNEDLILALNEDLFDFVVEELIPQFNRSVMRTVFPDINPFSLDYFVVDDNGFYTGEITAEAEQYIRDNFTAGIMAEFISDASAEDETRVTVQSTATLDVEGSSFASERTFKII
ncbi:MAG: hypothetical protein ACOC31_00155 [Bacteroidota bacterium]